MRTKKKACFFLLSVFLNIDEFFFERG